MHKAFNLMAHFVHFATTRFGNLTFEYVAHAKMEFFVFFFSPNKNVARACCK